MGKIQYKNTVNAHIQTVGIAYEAVFLCRVLKKERVHNGFLIESDNEILTNIYDLLCTIIFLLFIVIHLVGEEWHVDSGWYSWGAVLYFD